MRDGENEPEYSREARPAEVVVDTQPHRMLRLGQRPLKSGFLFSRNACTPSAKSALLTAAD